MNVRLRPIAMSTLTTVCGLSPLVFMPGAGQNKQGMAGISLGAKGDRVRLSVTDDGVGFAPDEVPRLHFGLIGMRYRVAAEGGQFTLHSAPGQGTRIEATLPAGMTLAQVQDQPSAVTTSVNEFVKVLIEAVVIVLAVTLEFWSR